MFPKTLIIFFIHQAILDSKPEGDSKLTNLRNQSQSLCEQEELEESRKQKVHQLVRETEEQWKMALQTAEEALNKAQTQALLDKRLDTFRTQSETIQSWIRDQEHKLQSVVGFMQVDKKLEAAKVSLKLHVN